MYILYGKYSNFFSIVQSYELLNPLDQNIEK